MSQHPAEETLALFAGNDLGFFQKRSVSKHVENCDSCRALVADYRSIALAVQDTAREMPEGLDWDQLALEMKANIRVGLAAGECVGPVRGHFDDRRLDWRAALVLGAATAVVLTGWFLMLPKPADLGMAKIKAPTAHEVVLEATQDGVGLKAGDHGITLVHSGNDAAVLTVSAQGSVRARYVDTETGQVTVTNVYAE